MLGAWNFPYSAWIAATCFTQASPVSYTHLDVYKRQAMNSVRYCQTMEEVMLPSVTKFLGDNFILQQDNAPCHKSNFTMIWFSEQDIEILQWPSRSPDLNPIENISNTMAHRLAKHKLKNKKDSKLITAHIWQNITKEECMPEVHRLHANGD